MKVKVTTNAQAVKRALRKISRDVRNRAVTNALNKTARNAKTAAAREIKNEYGIGTRVISRYISVQRATGATLTASVKAEGKPLPLIAFKARQAKQGVQVTIRGRRILIPHAFIATMKSGHKGVFARGGYKGSFARTGETFGKFAFGRKQLPINELFTFSAPQGFANKAVQAKVMARIDEQLPKNLAHELRRIFR